MSSRAAVALLALAACSKNLDELRAINARLELQLMEKKEIVQNLTQRRDEFERLQQLVEAALADAGVSEAELDAMPGSAPPPLPAPPTLLPPPSVWEGSEGARLRQQISDNQARSAALDKVLGPIGDLNRRKANAERVLKALDRLKQQRAQSNGAR